jgi:CO dehydrogenase/acetyl-CoA synthase epsilon subunit
MADDIRKSVLLTPVELQAFREAGNDVTILAVHSINPYTSEPSFKGLRIEGAIDTQAYTDFQSPATVEVASGHYPISRSGAEGAQVGIAQGEHDRRL